uniref:Uncharacterized protein n=1 Tax=uncultured marine virus TaxID=186617 RepID=A0A0F7L5B4_9VIRU|nr:hypothetical protein [uncultured marine virus]
MSNLLYSAKAALMCDSRTCPRPIASSRGRLTLPSASTAAPCTALKTSAATTNETAWMNGELVRSMLWGSSPRVTSSTTSPPSEYQTACAAFRCSTVSAASVRATPSATRREC